MKGLFKQKEKIAGQVIMIDINLLTANRSQPRTVFDEAELISLAESIKENGILQPVCVRRNGALYEIISGERRTRAASLAGLTEIPCIVLDVCDQQSAILALIENIQRKNLSYFEESLAIEKLISYYGFTQEEAAKRLGKAQSTIANKLRLLRFTDAERELLISGNLSERQARSLIRIEDNEKRKRTVDEVIRRKLNLEQTEELVQSVLNSCPKKSQTIENKTCRPKIFIPARAYMNSLNALIKRIKDDNIPCETSATKSDNYFEYILKFPINI